MIHLTFYGTNIIEILFVGGMNVLSFLQLIESDEDREFVCKLYDTYSSRMFRVAYGILKNETDAEDILQETFLYIINHLEKINRNFCHKTWNYIVTIVKTKSINLYNKKKKHPENELVEDLEMFGDDLEEKILEKEQQDLILTLLMEMREPYKSVMILQYYQQLEVEEISLIMDKTPDNIRHISMRGRKMLKEILKKRGVIVE